MRTIIIVIVVLLGLMAIGALTGGSKSKKRGGPRPKASSPSMDDLDWDVAMRHSSPSGNVTLAILQPIESIRGGSNGKIALFEGSRMLWFAQVRNPQEGCVTDIGNVFVVEQKWNTKTGYAKIYDRSGKILAHSMIKSALGGCGITSDQQYFWCELYRDKAKTLSKNRITLFRVTDGASTTTFDDPRDTFSALKGGVKSVGFVGGSIVFVSENGVSAEIDSSGKVLNQEALIQQNAMQRLHSDDGYTLVNLAGERLMNRQISELSEGERKEIKDLLIRADAGDISPNTHASINKTLGELASLENDMNATIGYFEIALKWNPKVGLKRRLESMTRKKQHKPSP